MQSGQRVREIKPLTFVLSCTLWVFCQQPTADAAHEVFAKVVCQAALRPAILQVK